MADISQYLANILSAVYGEDVRGSIHDAIEIINDVGEAVLTTGSGAPSGTTFENSLYIDTTNWIVYKYTSGAWASQGTIRGTDGVGITSITKSATAGLIDTYTILYTDGSSTTFDVTNGADGDDGNKWYRGTAISGKAVNPTVYSGSGITLANPNDFYLNITEGAIYYCVSGGDASTATWSYDFTMSGGGSTPEWVDVQNKPFDSVDTTGVLDITSNVLSADMSSYAPKTLTSDAWDSGTTYAVGDYCIYNNTLWKCLTANTATTPTEGSDWTARTVGEELGSLSSEITNLNSESEYHSQTLSSGLVIEYNEHICCLIANGVSVSGGYLINSTFTLPETLRPKNVVLAIQLHIVNSVRTIGYMQVLTSGKIQLLTINNEAVTGKGFFSCSWLR